MTTICKAIGSDRGRCRHKGGIRRAVLERVIGGQEGKLELLLGAWVIELEALLAGETGLLGLGEVSVGGDEGCAWCV